MICSGIRRTGRPAEPTGLLGPVRFPVLPILAMIPSMAPKATDAATAGPNIVVILADDLGQGSLLQTA